jgi:hypothetical protein
MSARTRTNNASPPARSIVSGEVTSSRARFGRARLTATLADLARLTFGCAFGLALCTRAWRRTGAAGACAGGGGVITGAGGGGDTTTDCGEGDGGGGGGGVTRAAGGGGGEGGGVAPGTGSGLGVCVFGGAGSGAGAAASTGPARTAPAQQARTKTDACRNNDRAELVIRALPQLGTTVGPRRFGSACQWRGGRDRSRVAQTQHARNTMYASPSPSPIPSMSRRSSAEGSEI